MKQDSLFSWRHLCEVQCVECRSVWLGVGPTGRPRWILQSLGLAVAEDLILFWMRYQMGDRTALDGWFVRLWSGQVQSANDVSGQSWQLRVRIPGCILRAKGILLGMLPRRRNIRFGLEES